MARVLTWTVVLVILAAGAVWVFRPGPFKPTVIATSGSAEPEDAWLDHLYSQNPQDAEAAAGYVQQIGEDAMPVVLAALRDPASDNDRRKSALKACSLLGTIASDAIPEAAGLLVNPELTAEAAAALSFMGPDAFEPLRMVATHSHPEVRREALRAIGKLQKRGPLDPTTVVPLLLNGMIDSDAGVRTVAATYLGIVQASPENAVPALIQALADAEVPVRLAAATALEEFGAAAMAAVPALKKAAGDKDEDVAREAGRALVVVSAQR